MDTVFQIAGLGLVAACLCLVVRPQSGAVGMLLSLAACIGILMVGIRFFSPVLTVVEQLRGLTGISDAATAPMLKVAGIGILTQVSGAVCEDAGEQALRRAVEIGGMFLALYVSLPLLTAVLELMEETLGR